MGDVRVSAASGTASDWAVSTVILGVGQLAWETDNLVLRIGNGVDLEPNLPIIARSADGTATPIIDDSDAGVSGSTVWSSLNTQAKIAAAVAQANAYTDSVLLGVQQGTTPRFDVAFQNADGTWGNRPSAYCVFAFTTNGSTVAPSWLVTQVDVLFYRV